MRNFRRTTLITTGCLAILVGIALARNFHINPQVWWLALTPTALLLKPKKRSSLIIVITLGFGLGLWRGSVYAQHLQTIQNLSGQKVTIEAVATSAAAYGRNAQLDFTVGSARLPEADNLPIAGRFRVGGFGVPMIYRGDTVRIRGKLYPGSGSYQGRISYAKLERLGTDSGVVNRLTRHFSAGIQTALPEPEASFGLGLLVGQRSTMPKETLDQLTAVGLIHIVAVSGYNVTILARFVARLKLGSKYQQLVLSLVLIGLFVLVTGFSASIVRAAIVSGLSLWAWFYGRRIRPVTLIAFTAALTGLVNPFYVWGDLGWYLSFLAFFGVLAIAPIIAARFLKRPRNLTMVLIETISAEVMTLPLIMMSFSQLSLVALLANVLIVPLVPIAMLLTAVAAAAGAWLAPLAGWLAWPAKWLLTYILDVVQALASIPSVLLHRSISLAAMLSFYLLAALVILTLHRRAVAKTATITDVNKPL